LSGALLKDALLWAKRYAIAVNIDPCDAMDHLSTDITTSVFRIVQEAMTNIAKHAGAQHVSICMDKIEGEQPYVSLRIHDNGCGFDVPTAEKKGFGLFNMKIRADQVGAILRIDSTINSGTTVHIDCPST